MYIGGHVSAAGGVSNAYKRAKDIGGNAVQIFSASPRVWARTAIAQAEYDRCAANQKTYGIDKTIIHAIYLVNLASDNPELVAKSRSCIEFDLKVDAALGADGVVVHIGSHLGKGFAAVAEQLVREIKTILQNTPDNSHFLIENSAGQNGKIGSDLSEIRYLLDAVASPRLGWCLDTCHAFNAGYDLGGNGEGNDLFAKITELKLWDSLKCIHVNDSKDVFDSGHDRHENLGEGKIGNELLRAFLSHSQIRKLPLILEVPGMDGKSGPDAENVNRLKKLLE